MQSTIITTISIAAPPERVFEYLSDLKYHYLWNPQLVSITPIKHLHEGATYHTESRVLGMAVGATNTVTSLKAPKELVLENTTGALHYKVRFDLVLRNDMKTFVRLSINITADSKIYKFTGPVLKQLAQRELRTDLQSLKVAVENGLQ